MKFEIIGIDNKLSPQETSNALRSAIDQGVRYVVQGNGSGAGAGHHRRVEKHNERNPGKEVVYLNYAAVDPDLTNSKCSYWHFRLDADTSMKMEALTTFMKDQPDVKKVYLINQNYSHGQQVAKYAKENLARKRPDIQIVGDDLHPLAQVRDFAPYVAKIKAAGADTVITGNWGSDLALLIKAANDAGLKRQVLHLLRRRHRHADRDGRGDRRQGVQGRLRPLNMGGEIRRLSDEYKKRFNDDWYTVGGLPRASRCCRCHGPGQDHRPGQGGGRDGRPEVQELQRRRRDAQVRPPAAAGAVHRRVGQGRRQVPGTTPENTGYNFLPVKYYEPYVASTPTIVRDEAAQPLTCSRLTGRGPIRHSGLFLFHADPEDR